MAMGTSERSPATPALKELVDVSKGLLERQKSNGPVEPAPQIGLRNGIRENTVEGFSGLGEGDSSSKWKMQIEWLEGLQNQVEEKERRAAEEKVKELRAREGTAHNKNVRWREEPVHKPYA